MSNLSNDFTSSNNPNEVNKVANTNLNIQSNNIAGRSKRIIKKSKRVMSMSSDEFTESSISRKIEEEIVNNNFQEDAEKSSDVVMQGSILYRYELDQIELEGLWSISDDVTKESFSYLHLKDRQSLLCSVRISEIDFSGLDNSEYSQNILDKYASKSREEYILNICSANLYESLLIPYSKIFSSVLNYLSGEYHGFFLYYNKTIEDRFDINFTLEDNQVRINGTI